MKRYISLICFALVAILMLTACGKSDAPATEPSDSAAPVSGSASQAPSGDATSGAQHEAADNGITVRFMDGDREMKAEAIESGMTVAEYTPEKDGAAFLGWFATPSMSILFDFAAPISEDTQIFAGFAAYREDDRDFFLVGNGTSPLLLASAWGGNITDEHKMARGESNRYSITFDALDGDEFQFAINSSWEDQRGFGYMTTGDLPDGTKAFEVRGGLGDSAKTANIACAFDGNYTFTLTTYPAEGDRFDTITFVRNGDATATGDIEFDYYIKGETVTGWGDVYDDETRFVNDGTGVHTLTIDIPDDKPFLFTSTVAGTTDVGPEYVKFDNLDDASKALFDDDNGNITAREAGTYTFVYDAASKTLSATRA